MNKMMDSDTIRKWVLENLETVDRLARRRFSKEALAEEASLFVLERLQADDWNSLRQYQGRARFRTYFSSVVFRQLEDFARKRFGRARIPIWIEKLGGIWTLLYRMLCLERNSFAEATARVADQRFDLEIGEIETAAEQILGRVIDCGSVVGNEMHYDEAADHPKSPSAVSSPYRKFEQEETDILVDELCRHLLGENVRKERRSAIYRLVGCTVELEPEERLLLKLCHQDGFSVSRAGKALGLNRFQVHGRMRRLYKRIKKEFERSGCADEIRLLLLSDGDTL